jgi:ADP-ribosylglycohydrolase
MAVENQCTARAACDRWYSGAYLLETVPSVLQVLALHAHDPEEAIVRAVNDTKDNDTIGAIVGAAVGALHGRQALPQRWLSQLSRRVGAADDGHIFDMIKVMRDHLRGHVSGSG